MSTYSDKLTDPRWQKKRLRVFERDNWKCVQCKRKDVSLHVHHKKYHKSGDPWRTDIQSLETLCSSCHEMEKNDGLLKIRTVRDGNEFFPKHPKRCRRYRKNNILAPCFVIYRLDACQYAIQWDLKYDNILYCLGGP